MRWAAPLIFAGTLGACGHPGEMLGQVPVTSSTMNGNYQAVADCAYDRLLRLAPSGIQKIDLKTQNVIKIALDGSGVRYWEATFSAVGPSQTKVDLTSAQTMWGPFPADKVWAEIRTCSA